MVRRLLSILFLMLLISSTETGTQLLKLPLLITHYNKHISEARSRSFEDFLKEHYAAKGHDDNDKKQDQQLPFKSAGIESFISIYVPFSQVIMIQHPGGSCSAPVLHPQDFTFQDHTTGVFHPPKLT
jgi:hypothetical protein